MRLIPSILLTLAVTCPLRSETELRMEGMKSVSEDDINRLIGGRFDHIRDQPASRARASDGAFMIEQLFRKNGYSEASVTWKILSSNSIRYRITEGHRNSLGDVTIEGVEDEELAEKLKGLFELNPSKRRIDSSGAPPFQESDIEAGLELVRAELRSEGFWEPAVNVTEQRENPETGNIDFTISVDKGKLHRISQPSYSQEKSPALDAKVAPFVNQTADTGNINGLRLAVTEYYRSKGFVNAKINMSVSFSDGFAHPNFSIIEGERFRLGEVSFDGLEKTKPERIRGRIEPLRNTYLDGNLADKRVRELIATGAFSSISMDTTEREGGIVDATLHFEEARARGISLTGGFGTYEGAIVGASYYDRNFGGQLRNFSAGGEITQRSLLGEISLTDPWLWGTDAHGKARLYSLSRDNEGYDNWTVGIEGSLSYPVTEHFTTEMALGYSIASTTSDGLPPARLGETDYHNPYLRFNQRIDYRDSPVLPTEGWHLDLPLVFGAAIGDASTSYLRTGFQSSYHYPLNDGAQIALGARADVIIPSGNQLPIDLRLFNGGPRSVRSYPERELGPHDRSGYPVGGQASWVTNIEYIRPVAGALKGVVFLDAGGLSPNWEDFGMDEIDVALGLGIRFDLPIGPVRLEYGHNLTHDPGEPSGSWHFAIGTAF